MFKWFKKHLVRNSVISVILIIALLLGGIGLRIEQENNHYYLRIGYPAYATGTLDYTFNGNPAHDTAQLQAALNALPATGGRIAILNGNVTFNANITRAIPNVTIDGVGAGTNLAFNGVNPVFTAGGNNWVFSNLKTDAGGINMGVTTGWVWNNVTIGATLYSFNSPSYITNPVGRTATYVVAASDVPEHVKAQADYVCDGTADDVQIQAAIDALTAGRTIIETIKLIGTFYFTDGILLDSYTSLEGQATFIPSVACGNGLINNRSGGVVHGLGETDIHLSDITVDCNSTLSSGIGFYGGDRITLERVTVRDVAHTNANYGYGVYIQDCDYVTLRTIKTINIAMRDGVQFKGCQHVYCDDIYGENTTLYGLDMHNSATPRDMADVTVIGLMAVGCGRFLQIGDATDIRIIAPKAYNCGWGLNIVSDVSGLDIISPYIDTITGDAGISTYYGTALEDIHIIGGRITNITGTTKDGILVNPNSTPYTLNGFIVSGTKIDATTRDGIRVVPNASGSITGVELISVQSENNTAGAGIRIFNTDDIHIIGGTSTGNDRGLTLDNADDTLINGLDVEGNVSSAISELNSPARTKYKDMLGYMTKNSGTATVLNTTTSIVVTHGLATTPTRIQITPRENPTNAVSYWWVDTLTTTQFTIHINTDPGTSNLDVDWYAQVGEG